MFIISIHYYRLVLFIGNVNSLIEAQQIIKHSFATFGVAWKKEHDTSLTGEDRQLKHGLEQS